MRDTPIVVIANKRSKEYTTPQREREERVDDGRTRVYAGAQECIIHVQQNPRTTAPGEELDASVFLFDDVSAFQQDFA